MTLEFTLEELPSIAKQILANTPSKTLLFYGEMGAGKTTLIGALAKALGVEEATSSPTFSLVNTYKTSKAETLHHFDFYRIKSEEEALDIGIEEYLYSDAYNFIEWPEKIPNLLPLNTNSIHLKVISPTKRSVTWS